MGRTRAVRTVYQLIYFKNTKISHTVSPRDGNCPSVDCVSVHYDVHICIRTCGHVIITSCAAAVPVKFAWTLIRKGYCPPAPWRSPEKCEQYTKIFVVLCVTSCVALVHCSSCILDRENRPLLTFGGWVLSTLRPPQPLHSPQKAEKQSIRLLKVLFLVNFGVSSFSTQTLHFISLKKTRSLLPSLPRCVCVSV